MVNLFILYSIIQIDFISYFFLLKEHTTYNQMKKLSEIVL